MTTKKAAAKKTAPKSAPRKSSKAGVDNYTNPDLRERIKAEVTAGDKGGRAGQWSARKAQLVAHEYEAQGGGYKHARPDALTVQTSPARKRTRMAPSSAGAAQCIM